MSLKFVFVATVLLAAVGKISSGGSSIGIGRSGYWGLSDEAILAELRSYYSNYLKSGSTDIVIHQDLRIILELLVTRGVVPYPVLAPNVAYVPAIGTNCMDYGDYSVFVDVHRGQITAVVDQSHCNSLQCERPSQNKQLDRIIDAIAYLELIHLIVSQIPNSGGRVLQPSRPAPIESLRSFDPIGPYGRY